MNFKRLTDPSEILALVQFHNSNSEFVVIDVETSSTEARTCQLFDIQISGTDEDSAIIFSVEHRQALNQLSERLTLVAHNYKFDAHVLFKHGVDLLSRTWWDTLLMGHLVDENRESHSLDSYVKELWNDGYKENFWAKYKSYEEAPEDDRISYACADIIYTDKLYRRLDAECVRQQIPDSLRTHVHRLQDSLLRTEIQGVRVDLPYLADLGVKLKNRINLLQPEMRNCAQEAIEEIELETWLTKLDKRKSDRGKAGVGRPVFNFGSARQLSDLLYRRLRLPAQRNDKTKEISTDFDSLEKIKALHPVVSLIQEHREVTKVYEAFIGGTLDRVDASRIYPQFRVAGTVTGRISHSNPNLAQLPKSGGIRGLYVPDNGRVFIAADYDQLEVTVEAHLTGDKNLLRIIRDGASKHDITAAELGCSRDLAKTINFASQYHCSHFKIAKLVGCSVDEGYKIWKRYWEAYSGPKHLKEQTDKEVDAGTTLVSCYGRKRRFKAQKRQSWDKAYKQAYNFKIQSPGADFMSEAFYLTSEELLKRGWGRGMFSIHDEGLIEVNDSVWEEAQAMLISNMESMALKYKLSVPLKAKGTGKMLRWEDK